MQRTFQCPIVKHIRDNIWIIDIWLSCPDPGWLALTEPPLGVVVSNGFYISICEGLKIGERLSKSLETFKCEVVVVVKGLDL